VYIYGAAQGVRQAPAGYDITSLNEQDFLIGTTPVLTSVLLIQ